MQQQWTAYSKNSQESCPAYGMGTYMDGESTEATKTVKYGSCIQIIVYTQSPGNAKAHMATYEPVAATLNS